MFDRSMNLATETISLLICAILLAYQLQRRKKSKTDKWLCLIIVSNICMLLSDITDCMLGGRPGKINYVLIAFMTLIVYFSAAGFLLLSFQGWLLAFAEQKERVSKWWMRIGYFLAAVQLVIALTLPITRFDYVDKASNFYTRGKLFWVALIFPYLIYFIAIIALLRFFKAFTPKERLYLGCFTIVPLAAQIIQLIFDEYLLLNVAVSLGLILIINFIQSQREIEKEEEMKAILLHERDRLEEMSGKQENLNSQLIDVLCGAVEAKDNYTRGHSLRVAQYAREIMYRMGGDERAQREVYYIGILHDVGKISIRDEIINKKGRLTDEEYEQIKLHTVSGFQILRGVDVIPDLADGARWHHERYDGTGYPNGLAGENIPLVARIISVADAYDAMTSNRSYHSVMPQSEVREQIVKGMGTQFDPKIAKIMLDMIDEDLQYEMQQINYYKMTSILLIDDDTFIHEMIDQVLSDQSYLITFAGSGEEGIALMKENRYDLCLLDMEMPGMNGFEVLEWIHKNIHKMKVIFLTGDKDIQTIRKSKELGAVDYVTKPINARILKESINSVLTH